MWSTRRAITWNFLRQLWSETNFRPPSPQILWESCQRCCVNLLHAFVILVAGTRLESRFAFKLKFEEKGSDWLMCNNYPLVQGARRPGKDRRRLSSSTFVLHIYLIFVTGFLSFFQFLSFFPRLHGVTCPNVMKITTVVTKVIFFPIPSLL